ncbi:hypothetical protein Mal52_31600 [Symmachiella dynata]|uniref:Uncharacterized protein n=1 Tax=Symmachiella dynata TaxID=2527995 RepID=A0A517ZQB7_9PLAN|nr:hypothetical protein Mal52_31600 [Symmachiella dynata]
MIRRRFVLAITQESRQRAAVRTPPSDAALRIDALEVTNEQHAKVNPRRNPRPTNVVGIKRFAPLLDKVIEVAGSKDRVEFVVENVLRHIRQRPGRHSKLPLLLLHPPSHAHRCTLPVELSYPRSKVRRQYNVRVKRGFSTGS